MVDKNLITAKLEFIRKHIERLRPYQVLSLDAFKNDSNAQDIVEYNLFQIMNHLISLAEYVVMDNDLEVPGNAYEAFEKLIEKKLFPENLAVLMRKMIGFRNVIGHEYVSIDKNLVHEILVYKLMDIQTVYAFFAENYL